MRTEQVRKLIARLPATEEGTSYGTPAWRAGGRLLARLLEDGRSLVVKIDMDDRELLVAAKPEVFEVTPHYSNHPWVVVNIARVDRRDLEGLLVDAWKRLAPRKVVRDYVENGG